MTKLSQNTIDKINKMLLNSTPEQIYQMVLDGQLNMFPKYFWCMPQNYEWAKGCTIYLFEQRLKWDRDTICNNFKASVLKDNKLGGMLASVFDGSPYLALDNAYPGEYKPWELKTNPMNYVNIDTAREATRWLIEEKLKWSREEVCKKLCVNTFRCNNLYGVLDRIFKASTYLALDNAYPGEYKPWELSCVPKNYWNLDTAKEATIWLIEEKLKWSRFDVCQKLKYKVFVDNSMLGMLYIFNNSPYAALENAYPGVYIKEGNKIKLKEEV